MLKKISPWLITLFSIGTFLAPRVLASEINVAIRLDRTEVTISDSVRMVVSVSGSRKVDAVPIIRGLEAFTVTKGGTSSRVEIVNTKMSSSIDTTYFIQPQKTGTFRIGPAQITVKDQTYESNVLELVVRKSANLKGGEKGAYFLDATLSKNRVYLEEQAVYTLKLYVGVQASEVTLPAFPENPNLTLKQIDKPSEYQSAVNGRTYHVIEIRYGLVPLKAGKTIVGPARMRITRVDRRRRSNPFFDDDFFNRPTGRPVVVAGEPHELEVLELPVDGKPADFTGLLGHYRLTSELNPMSVRAGESTTLTVRVNGQGNVNRIPDLTLPSMAGTKIYSDQPVLETLQGAEGLTGTKTMKWAIVPESAGPLPIPSLSLSFFDTERGQYRTLRTEPHVLLVEAGELKQETVIASNIDPGERQGPAKSEVEELGRDIMPIHTSLNRLSASRSVHPLGPAFWILLFAPLLVYIGLLASRKISHKSARATAAARAKRASNRFFKACEEGKPGAGEMIDLIRDYLNDRFSLSLGSITPAEVEIILIERRVSRDTALKLGRAVQELEGAIYSGGGDNRWSESDIRGIIKEIEREIRR